MSLSLSRAVEIVNQEFQIDIRTQSRKEVYVSGRQAYFLIAKKYCSERYSLDAIGKELATIENPKGWDHSSVLHNVAQITSLRETKQYNFEVPLKAARNRALLHSDIDDIEMLKQYESLSDVLKEFDTEFSMLIETTKAKIEAAKFNIKAQFLAEISKEVVELKEMENETR